MYKAKYINPYFGEIKKEYTLVIEDENGVLPTIRIDKQFDLNATEEEMAQEAQNTIINELLNPSVEINNPQGE